MGKGKGERESEITRQIERKRERGGKRKRELKGETDRGRLKEERGVGELKHRKMNWTL